MSRSSNDSAYSSWGRRKSIFALSALTPAGVPDAAKVDVLEKHRRQQPPSFSDIHRADASRESDELGSAPPPSESPKLRRPPINMRATLRRPPSGRFGSIRTSIRPTAEANDASAEPKSSTSTKAPSLPLTDGAMDGLASSKTVLMHGEVQTSAGMFRKKKEYLVLTDSSITRYKSQAKAAETFNTIPTTLGRSPTVRHGQVPSAGSQSDMQTVSDSSGEKDGRVLLDQIVAVHSLEDGKPYFVIEVCYLDEESAQASAMTLQLGNSQERDRWLQAVRGAVNEARLRDRQHIAAFNLENAARVIERDNDYDPANCAIFKVVQRQSTAKAGRSSSDDFSKIASSVCFLAIGVHNIHIVPLVKPVTRSSSPSLAPSTSQSSHGILTLTSVKLSKTDDAFELTIRQPLQRPRILYLASSASHEIAARLHFAENNLRPDCGIRLYKFDVPPDVEDILPSPVSAASEEHSCLERTLTAYCVAYGVNPANVRYSIGYECEDAPRFELLPPADSRRPEYGPLELLAIMRALRYNETFGSVSFANILLDSLNGLHDDYGAELLCRRTKTGTPIALTPQELSSSCLLVQEIRSLAATSKKLRRMDFSGCITTSTTKDAAVADVTDEDQAKARELGCGIVEALFPLCRHQTTNVDWICLNGIYLSDTDLDYLVGAAVEKACHFRAIELNRCGLSDRSLGLILDALRAQDNTLEAVEIAGNAARLEPAIFDGQLAMFGFLSKLDLSHVSRTSGPEPLLQAETLLIWRLSELRLSGTALNPATVDAIATYLGNSQSDSLHELYVDNTYLSGGDVATLLHSMMRGYGRRRSLHFDISQSRITKELEKVTHALARNYSPTHLSMRAIEYREESAFRKVLAALTVNKSIEYLDISQTALPGDTSEECCRALQRLLEENDTLVELNLAGEDSRLATSKFGPGINRALVGLESNETLRVLHIEKQSLGLQGASTLAEVLRGNCALQELHCDHNEIPLQGLTDLVNSLIENTTLIHLPTMDDGRAAAFKSAELSMKSISEMDSHPPRPSNGPRSPPVKSSTSTMKRGLASVRRTARRTASAYTPSFPALPSYTRSSSSPDSPRSPSTLSLTLPPPKFKQTSESRASAAAAAAAAAAPLSFTVQDVQTTHRLLTEQWNRQCYRLAQYLERNWCVLHDIPVAMEVEDEKFERPESVGSISKVLQQVKFDTTPKAERPLYFDQLGLGGDDTTNTTTTTITASASAGAPTTDAGDRFGYSFKQFIFDSDPSTPADSDEEFVDESKQSGNPAAVDQASQPGTPTQLGFAV